MKCVRFVEALDEREIDEIMAFGNENNQLCVVIDPNVTIKHLDNFLWKDDERAMEGVREGFSGPYKYVALFFA